MVFSESGPTTSASFSASARLFGARPPPPTKTNTVVSSGSASTAAIGRGLVGVELLEVADDHDPLARHERRALAPR